MTISQSRSFSSVVPHLGAASPPLLPDLTASLSRPHRSIISHQTCFPNDMYSSFAQFTPSPASPLDQIFARRISLLSVAIERLYNSTDGFVRVCRWQGVRRVVRKRIALETVHRSCICTMESANQLKALISSHQKRKSILPKPSTAKGRRREFREPSTRRKILSV